MLSARPVATFYVVFSILTSIVIFHALRSVIPASKGDDFLSEAANFARQWPDEKSEPFKTSQGRPRSVGESPLQSTFRCSGAYAGERTCVAKSICYSPGHDKFFVVGSEGDEMRRRWMRTGEERLLDLTSINDHNVFYFELEESAAFHEEVFRASEGKYISIDRPTFLFARFMNNNVMHNLHDDYIGQYLMHAAQDGAIDRDNYIFFADGISEAPFDHLLRALSKRPFIYRAILRSHEDAEKLPICFDELHIGNSKGGTWYQYGLFDEPQGPISGKTLDGRAVRRACDHLLQHYGLASRRSASYQVHELLKSPSKPRSQACITIFSRTKDRLILNESELANGLHKAFGLSVQLVRLEEMSFGEILDIMTRTVVAVGMHGSALILSLFMPAHAVLIEMFPYAVPPENYLPYRTLALLPGIDLVYRAWANQKPQENYVQLGDRRHIDNLSPYNAFNVLSMQTVPPHTCCSSLPWILRIYQDTVVDVSAVIDLVRNASLEAKLLSQASRGLVKKRQLELALSQHRVKAVEVEVSLQRDFIGQESVRLYRTVVRWESPWTTMKPAARPSGYGVWVEEYAREVITDSSVLTVETCTEGSELNIWIRPYFDRMPASPYSQRFTLVCKIAE